jgi:heat shock protein HslJ
MRHRTIPTIPLDLSLVGAVTLIALANAIALAACGTSARVASGIPVVTTTTPTSGAAGDVTHSAWILTQMIVDGVAQQVVAGRAPTLSFHPQDGTLLGNAGCNAYSADYTLAGDTLGLDHMAQTQALCMQPVVEQENAYLHAFWRVTRLHLANDTLTLSSSDGTVQLTFRPASGVSGA